MLDSFLYREEWILAIRKKGENLLFEEGGLNKQFNVIPNSRRYWCADPFLYTYNGKDYVFFEMYDRWKAKGLIGYREIIDDSNFSEMKIAFECDFHLSYPNIFEENGEIYIIPESYMANEIAMYKAVHFPDKWEKCSVLVDNIVACDTTFINDDYMLTMCNDSTNTKNEAVLFKRNGQVWIETDNNPVETSQSFARCAGKVFKYRDGLIRPAQDGVGGYGMGVYFRSIEQCSNNKYKERTITKVIIADIKYSGKKKYDGVHTYNFNDKYEIIDLKIAKAYHTISILSRCYGKASRVLKRMVRKICK